MNFWAWVWAGLAVLEAVSVGSDIEKADERSLIASLIKLCACILFSIAYWVKK